MVDVTINDFPVGDVVGAIEWNDRESKFEVDFDVKRDDLRTIALTETYSLFGKNNWIFI